MSNTLNSEEDERVHCAFVHELQESEEEDGVFEHLAEDQEVDVGGPRHND